MVKITCTRCGWVGTWEETEDSHVIYSTTLDEPWPVCPECGEGIFNEEVVCGRCGGYGVLEFDYLNDKWVTCPECGGENA